MSRAAFRTALRLGVVLLCLGACDAGGGGGATDGGGAPDGRPSDARPADVAAGTDVAADGSPFADALAPDVGDAVAPQDVAPDGVADALTDAAPDVQTDVPPDSAPDVVPDSAPDVLPDVLPDVPPDSAPDVPPLPPVLAFDPAVIRFGAPAPGEAAARTVALRNDGERELRVTGLELRGAPGFALAHGDVALALGDEGVVSLDLGPPLVVAGGAAADVALTYTAPDARSVEAVLRVHSDDEAAGWRDLPLLVGAEPPDRRLAVTPDPIDFGGVAVGAVGSVVVTLASIGAQPVTLRRVRLARDERAAFTIGATWAPPRVLPTMDTLPITIEYRPLAASARDAGGRPIPHTADLVVESDAAANPIVVPIEGIGEGDTCPAAVLSVDEVPSSGGSVEPGRLLHLRGGESRATYDPIAAYRWTVAAPTGSRNAFWPGSDARDPSYRVDLAGAYRFGLTVVDAVGQESCEEAVHEVRVPPPAPVYVEVVWDTPGDPDPWDEGPGVGSDVDLHVADASAPPPDPDEGPWFDPDRDCWAAHPEADWGAAVLRADLDGDGPEVIAVPTPANGATYRVAVHYAAANDTGPITATLRIHTAGALAWESAPHALAEGDLWDAARIRWPSGQVDPTPD